MDIAIHLRPNNPRAYFHRGYPKHRLQRYNEAIIDFSKSIDDDPYQGDAWFTRGNAYTYLGKEDLALADYVKAVALSPDNSGYVYARDAMKKRAQTKTKRHRKLPSVHFCKLKQEGGPLLSLWRADQCWLN